MIPFLLLLTVSAWVFSPFDGLGWVQYDIEEIPPWSLDSFEGHQCIETASGCHHFGWVDGQYDAKIYIRTGYFEQNSPCSTLWHELLHAQGLEHSQMPRSCILNYGFTH